MAPISNFKIMSVEENIDQLFRSALENAAETPPPSAWQGISNQLIQPNQAVSSGKTLAQKSWFAKLGLATKVALIGSVVAVVGTIVTLNVEQNDIQVAQNQEQSSKLIENNIEDAASNNESIQPKTQSNLDATSSSIENNQTVYSKLKAVNHEEESPSVFEEYHAENNLPVINYEYSQVQRNEKGKVDVENGEGSKVLSVIQNFGCKNSTVLSVAEADSNAKLIGVECNGNVKKLYIDFGDNLSAELNGNSVKLIHNYRVQFTKEFYVKAVAIFTNGCKDSAFTKVSVNPSISKENIIIPTVFTPNGDGKNDEYYVTIPEPKLFEMVVLDRNKKVIFSTTQYGESWNGNCFNIPCKDGNYEVVIKTQYSGEKESITTRWVNLNRNFNEN